MAMASLFVLFLFVLFVQRSYSNNVTDIAITEEDDSQSEEEAENTLDELILTNQAIKTLDETFISNHTQLQYLELSNNPIDSLDWIQSNTVTELKLEYGKLRVIGLSSLEHLPNLTTLQISHNVHLTDLSLNGSTLVHLYASHCSIVEITMQYLPMIQTVDFSHNRIKQLTEQSFIYNPNIRYLDLSYNDIITVEDYTFIRNTELKTLNLSHNDITNVDWSMTLKGVEVFDLSHNFVSNIDILMLRGVHTLNLAYNKVEQVPEEIGRLLPRISTLNLTGNPIRDIQKIKSKTLTHLILSECKISEIEKDAFAHTHKLQILDLTDNKLQSPVFLTKLKNSTLVYHHLNPWVCPCNFTLPLPILCNPINLTQVEFCNRTVEEVTTEQPWFLEAANPVVWAPLLAGAIVIIVCCFGYKLYRNRRQTSTGFDFDDFNWRSADSMDLIRNIPVLRKRYFQAEDGTLMQEVRPGPVRRQYQQRNGDLVYPSLKRKSDPTGAIKETEIHVP